MIYTLLYINNAFCVIDSMTSQQLSAVAIFESLSLNDINHYVGTLFPVNARPPTLFHVPDRFHPWIKHKFYAYYYVLYHPFHIESEIFLQKFNGHGVYDVEFDHVPSLQELINSVSFAQVREKPYDGFLPNGKWWHDDEDDSEFPQPIHVFITLPTLPVVKHILSLFDVWNKQIDDRQSFAYAHDICVHYVMSMWMIYATEFQTELNKYKSEFAIYSHIKAVSSQCKELEKKLHDLEQCYSSASHTPRQLSWAQKASLVAEKADLMKQISLLKTDIDKKSSSISQYSHLCYREPIYPVDRRINFVNTPVFKYVYAYSPSCLAVVEYKNNIRNKFYAFILGTQLDTKTKHNGSPIKMLVADVVGVIYDYLLSV